MLTSNASDNPSALAVHLDSVSCRIGDRVALDKLTLQVAGGTVAGILGANGSGKTTVLSILAGLRSATSGAAHVLGTRLPTRDRRWRAKIGVVLQDTALHEELTTSENLLFAASLYAVRNPKKRIADVLELLDLADRADERVLRLSGGMRRRVTIARALLHEPALIIADEPTLGVDVEARHAIWSHLRQLKAVGVTVVVASNYLDEALALCDNVTVLKDGRALVTETPAELVARAGLCLEFECDPARSGALAVVMRGLSQVTRVEFMADGLAVFLRGDAVPADVALVALQTTPIHAYRSRAADLAEIFQAIERERA